MGHSSDSRTTPFADMTDSLLGWASHSELELAEAFAGHPWFPDTGFGRDFLERLERLFVIFLSRQLAAGAQLSSLLDVTPALTSATLIARAAQLIDPEHFFAEFLAGLGLNPTDDLVAEVSARSDALIAQAGLEVPEGLSGVELLGYHAGIIGAEVAGVLGYCDQLEEQGGVEAATDVAEIAASLAAGVDGLAMTAASARGGRLTDLVTGIVALREFSREHPSSWVDRDRFGLAPLPRLVADAVVAELRERPIGTPERGTSVGVAHRELRPRLVLDAQRNRVCVRLPEQRVAAAFGGDPQDAEVSWRVNMAGTTREFRTNRPWGEPTYAEALDVAVEQPVTEVTVTDTTNGINWVVPVVDSEDPLLIFAANGQNLSDKASLHHSRLYVLTPEDTSLRDAVTGAAIPVAETSIVQGWQGWVCALIDASEAASLQAVRPGQAPSAMMRLRSVDPRQRVRFVHPSQPIAHVRTAAHLPVFATSLVADFPPTLSGRDEIWQLTISAYAGVGEATEEIADPEPLEVPAGGGAFQVFDPEAYDAPWVGEYLIRLRGPRNESFRHRYAIVESMVAHTSIDGGSHSVRIPAGGGLSPARLEVGHGPKEFSVSPRSIVVTPDQAGTDFVVETQEGDSLPLRFVPPALSFELPLTTYPPMWRTSRIFLGSRHLDPAGRIRVRATGQLGRPRVAIRNQHGSPVRTVDLVAEDALTYAAPAASIAQAAAVMPEGRLEFEWTDEQSGNRVSVTLALISSTPHATEALIEDGTLCLPDLVEGRSLAAWVWPATAPWARARVLPHITPRTPLPPELIDAGDLTVQLHSADPFTILRAPTRPGAGALLATQPGYLRDQPDELKELSAFLAGVSEQPPTGGDILPIIWDHCGTTQRERDVAGAVFQAAPTAALRGLADSLVPAHLQPGRMIASGLVNHVFDDADEHHDDRHSPWITAMILLGQLSGVLGGQSDTAKARDLLDQVGDIAGKTLVNTLLTGRDSTLDSACIDSSTVRIAHMDAAQQEQLIDMFFASTDIVPGPMMEDGQRLMAVFETFRMRTQLNELLTTEGLIKPAVSLLRALRSTNRALYSAARVRFDKIDGVNTEDKSNAWALAPVVSLVFALAARMHAHGLMGKSKTLSAAASGWSQLADLVPDLVTGDLLSADAMVLAASAALKNRN
ncbi:hypothetical protein ACUY3K_04150 [Corynebacterium uberis]